MPPGCLLTIAGLGEGEGTFAGDPKSIFKKLGFLKTTTVCGFSLYDIVLSHGWLSGTGDQHPPARGRLMNPEIPAQFWTPERRGADGEGAWDMYHP